MARRQGKRHEWRKPPFGVMHTRTPEFGLTWNRAGNRVVEPPREGSGDYRRPVPLVMGGGTSGNASSTALHHNPVPGLVPQDRRSEQQNLAFTPRRNGLPEPKAWRTADHWRQAGWQDRVLAAGLDPAAILAADRALELDLRTRTRAAQRPDPEGQRRPRALSPDPALIALAAAQARSAQQE